jgi:hypothetical protein
MNLNRIIIAASFLLIITGCNRENKPSTQVTTSPTTNISTPQVVTTTPTPTAVISTTPTISPSVVDALPTAKKKVVTIKLPASKEQLISADGIGVAKVGMTLGELKQMLAGKAEFTVKSPFIVDFDAIAVSMGGENQFYILYPALLRLADTDSIEALVTDNPKYRTEQGVGPGTTIKEAEAVYGDANLSYNSQNESREYVKFAKLDTKAIAFRTKPPQGKPVAGIYSSSKAELKQTKDFQPTATINLVEIYCRANCPLPKP